MSKQSSLLNFSIRNIISKDQSILDQARIRLLYYTLIIGFFAVGAVILSVDFRSSPLLAYTSISFMIGLAVLFKLLTFKPTYKSAIAHTLICFTTLITFINVYYTLQAVNIVTVQRVILIVVFSFFMLGQGWGFLYSIVNLAIVFVFLGLQYGHNYSISFKPEKLGEPTLIIASFLNLALFIYINSHFYNTFFKNIKQLTATSKDQEALHAKFQVALEKAEKSSQAKSEFLSTMSHEIRTPLNAVIGMSNLLMMGNPRPDQKENLDILKFSANNLLAIVNDVLDFNKIESGRVIFESTKFDLVELIQNICGGQIIKAEDKGLLFRLNIDDSLKDKVLVGDPTRVTQIIFNLVSNAIKFTAKGGVWVKVACIQERHDAVTVGFSVKDTGIGIDPDNLEAIFEPFTQESVSTTRQYGGTGLGLAIVKRLLELQGREMNVSSVVGEGSEFFFAMEFPVSTESGENLAQKQQAVSCDDNGISNLRVLIAEDNPINVLLMKKFFSKWKIVPSVAENGERAVRMIQYGNFDVVLMDLQMPVMNGFDAAIEIRNMRDRVKANIPIIALTASALFDIREKIHNSGMNDYVSKPFKPDELLEKMQNLTSRLN